MTFNEDINPFYSDLATPVTRNGVDFLAFIDSADLAQWEVTRVTTHVLQYRDDTELAVGDVLTTKTSTYKVAVRPKRINDCEYQAEVAKQ